MPGPTTTIPKIWLKADAGVYNDAGTTLCTNGQTVRQWNDQSGNSNNVAQSTSSNRPAYITNVLNGIPSIRFDSARPDFLDTPSIFDSSYDTAFAFYFIGIDNASSSEKPIILSISGLQFFFMFDHTSGPNTDINLNGLNLSKVKIRSVSGNVYGSLSYNGSYVRSISNNSAINHSTTGNLGISGVGRIGAYTGGAGFDWHGDICELLIYNTMLSASEEVALRNYFAGRYPSLITNSQKLIICDGDSLTEGFGSTNANTYPYYLESNLGSNFYVINSGISGQTLAQMEADASVEIDPFYASNNIIVVFGGTNDLYFGATAAATETAYTTYCTNRKAVGWKVVACTILPRSDGGTPVDFESNRQTFNTWLRNNYHSFANTLVDFAGDSRIGDSGDELDTTYYSGDHVHMNSVGYNVLANLLSPLLPPLLSGGTMALTALSGIICP